MNNFEPIGGNELASSFPPYPKSYGDILNTPFDGEWIACTIVNEFTTKQLLAFRNLRLAIGQAAFLRALAQAWIILQKNSDITRVGAFVYCFIRKELTYDR